MCSVDIVFPVEALVSFDGYTLFRDGYPASFQSAREGDGHQVVFSPQRMGCSRFFGGLDAGRDLFDDINDGGNRPDDDDGRLPCGLVSRQPRFLSLHSR